MAVPKSNSDDALLKNLVPLNTLSDEQLGRLLSRIVVEKAKKGEYLFREGDKDHQNIYLLSGTISLLSGKKEVDVVTSGTQTARFALAHQLPRKHSARAKGPVTYVRIDSRILSGLLARSQSASYEVNEEGASGKGDWMSQMLRSPVFQQIPPANLQRVMMRMREITVSADDVIIQQGSEGDYFYLISRGLCRVTRQPSEDSPPVELAELKAGQGFGEEALISDKPRSSTVTMLTDGELVRLSKKDFVELVKRPVSNNIDYVHACAMAEENALWIDVRTPEEYDVAYLPGAINLPFFSIRFQALSLASDRNYLIYGTDEGQAETAAYLLLERGYEVLALKEGWHEIAQQAGMETVDIDPTVDNIIEFNRDTDDSSEADPDQTDQETDENDSELHKELIESRKAYEAKLSQYQAEQKLLKQALSAAKRKIEQSEKEVQNTRKELDKKIQKLDAGLKEKEAKLIGYKELTESERKLKQQVKALEGERNQIHDELQSSVSNVARVTETQSQLEKALQSTRLQSQQTERQLRDELAALKQQLEASAASLAELEQQSKEKITENEESVRLLQTQLKIAHEETEQALQQAREATADEYQLTISDLQKELEVSSTEVQRQENELLSLNRSLEDLRQETSEQAQEKDQLGESLQEALTKLEDLQQHMTDADTLGQQKLKSIEDMLEASKAETQTSNEALAETRLEMKDLEDRRIKLEDLFEQERQTKEFLKRSLETAEEAVEISDTANEEGNQELNRLKQELADHQANVALMESSHTEMEQAHANAIQELRDEYAKQKNELEQTIIEQREGEEHLQLQLASLQTENAQIETQLAQVQKSLQEKEQVFDSTIAEQQHMIDQLEKGLMAARAELELSTQDHAETQVSQQALQSAQQEIVRLKKNVEDLREVQLEMESQLSEDSEEELQRLRVALENEEKKRKNAEKLAKQADVLRREREMQETAVEMLSEDIENLNCENKQLVAEKDDLSQQLSELRSQFSDLMHENNNLHSDVSEFRGHAGDSHLADDMFSQLEEWRSKADSYEHERDEAKADAVRMKREISELRSVIETYVEQIQSVGSLDSSDALKALRTELEIVRRQASEDLEQMRTQLTEAESRGLDQGDRDISTAASLQALRQEVHSSQLALNEKEHLMRMSQAQCRTLEDAIEDRDKEVDHLKRKLELILRKTGGLGELSEMLNSTLSSDTQRLPEGSEQLTYQPNEQVSKAVKETVEDNHRTALGRLFKKR